MQEIINIEVGSLRLCLCGCWFTLVLSFLRALEFEGSNDIIYI